MSYQKLSHDIEPGEIVEYKGPAGTLGRAKFVKELTTEMDGRIIVVLARRLDDDQPVEIRYARGRKIRLHAPE